MCTQGIPHVSWTDWAVWGSEQHRLFLPQMASITSQVGPPQHLIDRGTSYQTVGLGAAEGTAAWFRQVGQRPRLTKQFLKLESWLCHLPMGCPQACANSHCAASRAL